MRPRITRARKRAHNGRRRTRRRTLIERDTLLLSQRFLQGLQSVLAARILADQSAASTRCCAMDRVSEPIAAEGAAEVQNGARLHLVAVLLRLARRLDKAL